MDIELIQCDRESRHMATADYWPDILEKLDDKEAENARRTIGIMKGGSIIITKRHATRIGNEYRGESTNRRRDAKSRFTAFLLLDDYREHNFRAKWRGTNRAGREYRASPPASPTLPSTPPRQPAITDRSLTTLEAQPTGIGAPEGRP